MKKFFLTYTPAFMVATTLLAAIGQHLVGNSDASAAYVIAFAAWIFIAGGAPFNTPD